jgi:arylsulfatase A-like enzyme
MSPRSPGLALIAAFAAGPACTRESGVDLSMYADRLVEGRVVDEGKAFAADVQGRMIYIDDAGLRVLPASPPSKLVLKTDIPRGGVLHVAAGIPEDRQSKGAVEFVIGVMERGKNQTILSEVIDPISKPEHRVYVDLRADLSRFAGKGREIVLETRAFEKDGDLFRAYWGAPAISVDPKFGAAPNPLVIVYLVDTLRADHTTPYGYPRETTPQLKAFARDAVLFEEAMAHASWTKPSVASLMTSRLPSRHRAVQLRDPLDSGQVTLAEMLDAKGFATGAVIANSVIYAADANFQQGFEVFLGLHGEEGRRSKVVDTRLVVDQALEFVDSRRGLPTFLYVHTMDPHVPYAPPPPFDTMFEPRASPGHPGLDPRSDFKEPLDRERLIAQYDGDIAYGDQQFGRFIDELKKRGVYDDALIFFVADHGEEFQDHGEWLHGKSVFDELIHVPLIVKFSGKRGAGSRVRQMVALSDVLPTVLEALDLKVPDPPAIVGRPLQGVAFGNAPEPPVVSEISHRGFVSTGIRTGVAKYVRRFAPQADELFFDLAGDPKETRNLIDQKPEALRRLRSAVEATMQVTPYRYAIRSLSAQAQTLLVETPGWIEGVETAGLGLKERAEIGNSGRLLEITLWPGGGGGGAREIFFRLRPTGVPVTLRGRLGSRDLAAGDVSVGESGAHPSALPFALPGLDADSVEGLFKPGPARSGVVVYLDQPSGRAVKDLDCSRIEEMCALGYLAGKACDQKCPAK